MFARAPADARVHFFAMSFNNKGNLVTFVDPPAALVNSLGLFIRAVFPRRIVNEQVSDDGTFTITLNPGINGTLCLPLYAALFSVSSLPVMVAMISQQWAPRKITFWPKFSSTST